MRLRNLAALGAALILTAGIAEAQPYGPPPPDSRDMYCRDEAARSTGYTTPGEAASHEQANGTIGGVLAGGALGAIIGGAAGNAGTGAAIGAGAGLVAGSAAGSQNAREAAREVRRDYDDTYYACMREASNGPPPDYRAEPDDDR
jgi:hypothetical protein